MFFFLKNSTIEEKKKIILYSSSSATFLLLDRVGVKKGVGTVELGDLGGLYTISRGAVEISAVKYFLCS